MRFKHEEEHRDKSSIIDGLPDMLCIARGKENKPPKFCPNCGKAFSFPSTSKTGGYECVCGFRFVFTTMIAFVPLMYRMRKEGSSAHSLIFGMCK
jgi:hypothetical protein